MISQAEESRLKYSQSNQSRRHQNNLKGQGQFQANIYANVNAQGRQHMSPNDYKYMPGNNVVHGVVPVGGRNAQGNFRFDDSMKQMKHKSVN